MKAEKISLHFFLLKKKYAYIQKQRLDAFSVYASQSPLPKKNYLLFFEGWNNLVIRFFIKNESMRIYRSNV